MRLFANTNHSDGAQIIFDSLFEDFKLCFQNIDVLKNEPYWKMDDVFVVEANMEYIGDVTDEQFISFLESIADKWQFFGEIVKEEALASDTMEECNFLKKGVKMINIIY